MRVDETGKKRLAAQIDLRSILPRRRNTAGVIHEYALLRDELAVLIQQ
jgi:hypothetical protein